MLLLCLLSYKNCNAVRNLVRLLTSSMNFCNSAALMLPLMNCARIALFSCAINGSIFAGCAGCACCDRCTALFKNSNIVAVLLAGIILRCWLIWCGLRRWPVGAVLNCCRYFYNIPLREVGVFIKRICKRLDGSIFRV